MVDTFCFAETLIDPPPLPPLEKIIPSSYTPDTIPEYYTKPEDCKQYLNMVYNTWICIDTSHSCPGAAHLCNLRLRPRASIDSSRAWPWAH